VKRFFRIFDLSKNEQRVVLIVMLVLIALAFVGYKTRVHHRVGQLTPATESKPSPMPAQSENDH